MAAADEPLVLPVGTEVSAKYRGAFCEAKVKKIVRVVKCKVTVTDPKQQLTVLDDDIKGTLKAGSKVEVKLPDSGQFVDGTLGKLTDCSQYTVVFDDGDENTLRRTQLCLKGEKHFVKSETLDQLPLTHPEHFGTPVMKVYKGQKRRRAGGGAQSAGGGANSLSESESESESSSCGSPSKKMYKGRLHDQIGRVLCMELEDRKKTIWVPVLVVSPSATDTDLKSREHVVVKSFKDGRFYTVDRRDTKEFVRETAIKNEDKALKPAMEKALAYFDTRDLPSTWDRDELLGEDSEDEEENETSDDEPSEEKDHFVAQLYKFMDDRGTPINKAPSIGNQDLNLYRLFKLVRNLGGYNKVTNLIKWKLVYSKMNLPQSSNAYNQIRTAYKKYLHAYEDFYRKLGSTMGNSRSGRTRHHSSRSLLPFREREAGGQPKSPRSDKKKEDKDTEDSDDEEKAKLNAEKVAENKGKKDEKKKEEETEEDSPRKRRGRAGVEKKEEKKEEESQRVTKRMTREDTAKLKEESKVKAEEERTRRSTSKKQGEPETEEKEETGQKRKSTRKKAPKEEKEEQKKKEKEEPVSDGGPDEESDDDEDQAPPPPPIKEETSGRKIGKKDLVIGTKLKVRYGRGRNQKIYEAKVIESEQEGNYTHYLVHYAGWNTRYDEWVQRDRIVTIVSEGTEADRKAIANKALKSPKSVVKKNQRPKTPSAVTPKADTSKGQKAKIPAATTTSGGPKSRPTRSSGQEPVTPALPTRKSRRHGSAVGDNASDVQSHVSYSDSEDESVSEDKKIDTDDTDSLKAKSDKSTDSSSYKPKTYSKSKPGAKKQEKETDLSDSESESMDSASKEGKAKGKTEKITAAGKAKTDLKTETGKEEEREEEMKEEQGKSGSVKSETGQGEETGGIDMSTIIENQAKDLMNKDEDAQSEDDIIKDLKHIHHIDMGDILMDSDSDMPIATPKPKPGKDGAKGGKNRKSLDGTDKLCGRQDSMETVAYSYDVHIGLQDAVENILQQLDEGDDDSDDLSFLTPTKDIKDVFQSLDADKKEDPKPKKEKKVAEKAKEKGEKTPKGKGKKKEKGAMTPVSEQKGESEGEKNKKPEPEKKKKKKAKKKVELKEPEKEEEKDVKEKEGESGVVSEEAPAPPQLNLVSPNKEKTTEGVKSEAVESDISSVPPKLQAERMLGVESEKEQKEGEKKVSGSVETTQLPTQNTSLSQDNDKPGTALKLPDATPTTTPTPTSSQQNPTSIHPPTSTAQPKPTSLPAPPTPVVIPTPTTPTSSTPSSHPTKDSDPSHKSISTPPQTSSTHPTQSPSTSQPTSSTYTPQPIQPTTLTPFTPTPSNTNSLPSKPQPSPSIPTTTTNPTPTTPAPKPTTSPKPTPAPTTSQQSVFDDTPPETPEASPSRSSDDSKSPTHPTTTTEPKPTHTTQDTKCENTESRRTFSSILPGAESPNTCDTSTISNGSEGSSSGNMPSSEDSTEGSMTATVAPTGGSEKKRKQAPTEEPHTQPKKRKRGPKRSVQDKGKSTPKHTMSDSDEGGEGTSSSPKRSEASSTTTSTTNTPNKKPTTTATTTTITTPTALAMPGTSSQSLAELSRPLNTSTKYNLNLEEGDYLTGEKRISFLMEKLLEIRKIYMGLKAEVACIDRRKKRLKRREKEGTAIALASLANS